MPEAYRKVASNLGCLYFDANTVTGASKVEIARKNGTPEDQTTAFPPHKIVGKVYSPISLQAVGPHSLRRSFLVLR
jgi:hypothetical protein